METIKSIWNIKELKHKNYNLISHIYIRFGIKIIYGNYRHSYIKSIIKNTKK